ncbi:MAG: hypothetical protein M3M88_05775 [Thermoproteota archaeon]|nr:hypothetical protein [Thermoproteota archaeon]
MKQWLRGIGSKYVRFTCDADMATVSGKRGVRRITNGSFNKRKAISKWVLFLSVFEPLVWFLVTIPQNI